MLMNFLIVPYICLDGAASLYCYLVINAVSVAKNCSDIANGH